MNVFLLLIQNDKPKTVNIIEAKLYCNYIFLDTKESILHKIIMNI